MVENTTSFKRCDIDSLSPSGVLRAVWLLSGTVTAGELDRGVNLSLSEWVCFTGLPCPEERFWRLCWVLSRMPCVGLHLARLCWVLSRMLCVLDFVPLEGWFCTRYDFLKPWCSPIGPIVCGDVLTCGSDYCAYVWEGLRPLRSRVALTALKNVVHPSRLLSNTQQIARVDLTQLE